MGKGQFLQKLIDFVDLLDRDELRASRPADFIFLCGGFSSETIGPPYYSLRQYLLQHNSFRKKLDAYLVLAEDAQNIFDDRYYDDLISFEEDIARAASAIAIISESSGSLAELGAFASIPEIAKTTCVIQQTSFRDTRSFVTLGPIKRMSGTFDGSVAYYPWRRNGQKVFHTTCREHVPHIAEYLNSRVKINNKSFNLRKDKNTELIFFILWTVFLYQEVSVQRIYNTIKAIFAGITETEIKAKLYALLVSKWIGEESYSGKNYYYSRFDHDPMIYRFKEPGHRIDDYKIEIVKELKSAEVIPPHVKKLGRLTRSENR